MAQKKTKKRIPALPRPTRALAHQRAMAICPRLEEVYPAAESALHFHNPFELLIAVILSAQTTDVAVNKVTPKLFAKWPTAEALAQADREELEEILRTIGFYRSKAQAITTTAQMLVGEFGGMVPDTMEELITLRGVGRKTANIVLNECFGKVEGIAVDTHVFRLAHRFGISPASSKTPEAVERDLLKAIPEQMWGPVNHTWVLFGRDWCTAKRPRCTECPIRDICPSSDRYI